MSEMNWKAEMPAFKEKTDELQKLTENPMYEDWMTEYQKALSGELSPEQMNQTISQIQQEMLSKGIDESLVGSFWTSLEEIELNYDKIIAF